MSTLASIASALLVAALFAPLNLAAATTGSRHPAVQSVDIQIPFAPMPVTVAGERILAYELHITNFRPVDVELLQIEVLNAATRTPLAELSGSQLASRLGRVGKPAPDDELRRIPAGARAIVYVWMPVERGMAMPDQLQHRIELDLLRPSGRERTVVVDSGCELRNRQPLVLDAPVRGGPWVALYSPTIVGGHRTSVYTLNGRARIPARFAIDWVKLADDATHARGDAEKIKNWHGYGAEVLAVADGRIVDAVDDMSEGANVSDASGSVALEQASGNFITLDLGAGRYAFYEHLEHGSIAVKAGDRVKRGQVIARLGNSGSSSSGPHLHFHVADGSMELAAEGVPYVFRNFEVLGGYADIETFTTGEHWQPLPTGAGRRNLELPAANTVVMFPN